ncbi:Snf2 domain-containing protein classy [Thalictrum thalictroides]|uniref:Snf2 domain-containing protein classy n=1 Tax=Thalictrum thalictroides TaxID=46969 RepID=A0A7J6UXR7_THATH|nr:Snf2 domain-containing protein classy [Thalictrum thalictroides]
MDFYEKPIGKRTRFETNKYFKRKHEEIFGTNRRKACNAAQSSQHSCENTEEFVSSDEKGVRGFQKSKKKLVIEDDDIVQLIDGFEESGKKSSSKIGFDEKRDKEKGSSGLVGLRGSSELNRKDVDKGKNVDLDLSSGEESNEVDETDSSDDGVEILSSSSEDEDGDDSESSEEGSDEDSGDESDEEMPKRGKVVEQNTVSNAKKSVKVLSISSEESSSSSEDEDDSEDEDEWLDEDSDESSENRLKMKTVSGSKVVSPSRKDAQVTNISNEESTSCSDDDDDVDIEDVEECADDDSDECSEKRPKRKRVSGSNDVHPAKRIVGASKTTSSTDCDARRTRSHDCPSSYSNKSVGTLSHPICLDEEIDDRSENASDEGDDNDERNKDVGDVPAKNIVKASKTSKGDALNDVSLHDILVTTILEKGGKLQQEEPVPLVDVDEPFLLKFNFGVENSNPVEKSDEEKFVDKLWDEYDFALRSCEIGSFGTSAIDTEEPNEPYLEIDAASLCSRGKHDLILDEQIGIKCRLCSFVKTEIKYILPSLGKCRYGRSARQYCGNDGDLSMWELSHFHNAGHDSQGSYVHFKNTVWDIFPRIREKMKQHQQEGFEFLWKNIAGGIEIDKIKKTARSGSTGSIGGCIISHAPGTGKTLLTIFFLRSYMEIFKDCRAVIVAPSSMLLPWEEEFKKWKAEIPFHNLNSLQLSGKEDEMACELLHGKTRNREWIRLLKLLSWSKGKSVLGISYNLFMKLVEERNMKDDDNKKQKAILYAKKTEEMRRILHEKPSLLVLDEGHLARNKKSLICKALGKIKTERRIILSGTPFQNNFEELYTTLSLVRPKFLNSISTSKMHIRSDLDEGKEARSKWASLTKSIGKHADDRLLEIRALMAPFVHVHKGSILKESVPGLRDCLVVLEPLPLQMKLLEEVQEILKRKHLGLQHAVSLVSIHPSLLTECGRSKNKNYDEGVIDEIKWKGFKLELNEINSKQFRLDPSHGVKTRFLMELIQLSEAKKEKVLVFSQFVEPFFLIKDQLRHHRNWTEDEEILQMDGKKNVTLRQSIIKRFNDEKSKVRVLLASTKACSEGINLTGASRVVLLDVVWNPSVEKQAIGRAHRFGQKKMVYTYHLITSGSLEEEKYRKQVSKDHLSELVFSSSQNCEDKEGKDSSSTICNDVILDEMVGSKKLKDMFKKIIYHPKESHLILNPIR